MIGIYAKSDKDCLRACIASILEKEYDEIPEVDPELPHEEFWAKYREVLNKFGFEPVTIEKESSLDLKIFTIGLGKSGEIDHAVVCYEGHVVHDPSCSKMSVVEQYLLLIPMFPWKYQSEMTSKNFYIGEAK